MVVTQKGFTLIELIVVILILGVLSATALPRFMSAQVDARVAKAQGLYGAIRSAASLAKARCELDLGRGLVGAGECGSGTPQVTLDGTVVDIVNKYPAATGAGILAATQLDAANDSLTITAGPPYRIEVVGAATSALAVLAMGKRKMHEPKVPIKLYIYRSIALSQTAPWRYFYAKLPDITGSFLTSCEYAAANTAPYQKSVNCDLGHTNDIRDTGWA